MGVGYKPTPSYMESFPTIEEGSHHRCKSQSVEFPIDPSAIRFIRKSEQDTIPFEEIGREVEKLNAVPINLRWISHGGAEELAPMVGDKLEESKRTGNRGPTRQCPWFRLPPKVQIVLGILGRAPSVEPRVVYPGEGELKLRDDVEFGHC